MAKNESLEDILRKLEEAEKEYSRKLEEIDLDAVIEKATHTAVK